MKMKWTVPVALTVLLATGCGAQNTKTVSTADKTAPAQKTEEVKKQAITIHDKSILKDSPTINIIYPEIDGMKDKGAQAKINEQLKTSASVKDESEFENNSDPSMPSSFSSKYQITFQNDSLIQFVYDQYLYAGGAHGMPARIPILVDLDNGRIVDPSEFFNGSDQIKPVISQVVLKKDVLHTLNSFGEFSQISSDDLKNIYLTKDGLTIFFSPYEYASFADGTLQYHLSFSDINSIVNGSFFKNHGIDTAIQDTAVTLYFAEGYHFSVPKKWMDQLVFERGEYSENNSWSGAINVYYQSAGGPLLFSIHSYDKEKWAARNPGNEIKLTEDHDVIYSYSVVQNPQDTGPVKVFKNGIVPVIMKTFKIDF